MTGNLIQLPPPTGLKWGVQYRRERSQNDAFEMVPQAFSWEMKGGHTYKFRVALYRADPDGDVMLSSFNTGYFKNSDITWFSDNLSNIMATADISLESGKYYFTVAALGDNVFYADSAPAESSVLTYIKPARILPDITAVSWEWPAIRVADPVADPFLRSYSVMVYQEIVPSERKMFFTKHDVQLRPDGTAVIPPLANLEAFPPNRRRGRYFFKICAMSSDINQCQNGRWSPLSAGWTYME